jgi:hypothetical protein
MAAGEGIGEADGRRVSRPHRWRAKRSYFEPRKTRNPRKGSTLPPSAGFLCSFVFFVVDPSFA